MMNLAKLFLILLSSSALAQEKEEEPKWETWQAQYEKGIGLTKVNMALKAPDASVPYVLITGVNILDCKNGLPATNGKDILELVTDAVSRQMNMLVKTVQAGSFTYNCGYTNYFYISDTTYVEYLLQELYRNNFPQYKFNITIRSDEQWQEYLQKLYLTDERRKHVKVQ